ncbi:hypothetical protein Tco_0040504 [Tanacetum coccineum]
MLLLSLPDVSSDSLGIGTRSVTRLLRGVSMLGVLALTEENLRHLFKGIMLLLMNTLNSLNTVKFEFDVWLSALRYSLLPSFPYRDVEN